VKRAEDILRRELESTAGNVEALAGEVATRKHELETALEAARLATSEAQQANQAKTEFLAVMSHELRTPLTAIVGYTELIRDGIAGDVSPPQQEMLDRITQSSSHLLQLIDQILEHSRIEAGRETVNPEPVKMASLVRETSELIEPLAHGKGLAFRVDVEQAPDEIFTDAGKLRQILVNLLGNAVKFTDRGEVALRVQAEGDQVVFTVRDTGIGIPPEAQRKVFDPFWQAEQGYTRQAGGTGLGLSVTRQLAQLLGGNVAVESTPGQGSTFAVRLPARGAQTEAGAL
jgi:signal transduction histidine kinase